jgi:CheY-like chemotaxis protein
VEDNPVNREVALALLEKEGIAWPSRRTAARPSRRSAGRHRTKGAFDIVLMDVQMP